jgi:2-polyprenyl-3-methyl-5-hydroxy-6-metoxy-1,4-benzoquinol methylase
MPLALPSREAIGHSIDSGSSEDYHLIRLYYSWYGGWFYRRRLKMVADLLGGMHVGRILEVGVGSGIFIKELLKHADFVTGIDVHSTYHGVQRMLEQEKVDLSRVELRQGNIFSIPYEDARFDVIVCVSVLEHFPDPRPALLEMRRTVKYGGILALGFPARNFITDLLFRILGYNAPDMHPADHHTVLKSVHDVLSVDRLRMFPSPLLPLYVACRAVRKT